MRLYRTNFITLALKLHVSAHGNMPSPWESCNPYPESCKRFTFPTICTTDLAETSALHNKFPLKNIHVVKLTNSISSHLVEKLYHDTICLNIDLYPFHLTPRAGFPTRAICRAIHTFHVRTYTIYTLTSPSTLPCFSSTSRLNHVSRDDRTDITSLLISLSRRRTLTYNCSASRLNNYTNTYGGTIILSDIIKHILHQLLRRHYHVSGYY
jgi:hypothetical protein